MFASSRQRAIQLAKESPVVVMARGHSGTRVLAWAIEKLGIRMGATRDVPTGDVQDRRFSRAIKKICRATLHQPPTAEPHGRLLRMFHHRLTRYLEWLGERPGGWGWKFPETYLIPNYVAATFPQARYIHMVRDGRDVAFKQHLTDDPNRRLGRRLLRHLDALDKSHHVQAALSWDFQLRRYEQFVHYAQPAVLTITYESFCRDPLGSMQEVCGFLGRDMTDECRDYLLAEVRPEKIAQYRHEDPQQIAEVEAAIAPTLVRMGYFRRAA